MIGLAALALVAIVNADAVPLRAAPAGQAPQQAVLTAGDSLEVRGRRHDWLQVWDHRRERGGFVRASQARVHALGTSQADELLAIVRFLRDTPGQEAQGIGYVAAFVKAAPAERIDVEAFDALGTMAERLARRASAARGRAADTALAAQLEVASAYGVTMRSVDRGALGAMLLCYDGEAHRQVLARRPDPQQRARAVLALTRHDCIDPAMPAIERQLLDRWRGDLLAQTDLADLAEHERNRVRLRQAGVWATLAHHAARRGEPGDDLAQRALDALLLVRRADLADSDVAEYAEAAVRVGASRWAAEPAPPSPPIKAHLTLAARAGEAGQTCVQLLDARKPGSVLAGRCTYGVAWNASFTTNAQGTAAALAVQPLAGWRELWLFRRSAQGWRIDVLPPGTDAPEVGYLEAAGFSADGTRLLAARETVANGRHRRSFEVIRLSTLEVERRADSPQALSAFVRARSPQWQRMTVSLR